MQILRRECEINSLYQKMVAVGIVETYWSINTACNQQITPRWISNFHNWLCEFNELICKSDLFRRFSTVHFYKVKSSENSRLESTTENWELRMGCDTKWLVIYLLASIFIQLFVAIPDSNSVIWGSSDYVTSFLMHIHRYYLVRVALHNDWQVLIAPIINQQIASFSTPKHS